MMTTYKEMTWDDWEKEYKPIDNVNNVFEGTCNNRFETFGEDLEFVKNYPHADRIWTLMDSGDIVNGRHFVNRQGYYITEKPWDSNEIIEVKEEELDIDGEVGYDDYDEQESEYDDDDDDGTEDGIF